MTTLSLEQALDLLGSTKCSNTQRWRLVSLVLRDLLCERNTDLARTVKLRKSVKLDEEQRDWIKENQEAGKETASPEDYNPRFAGFVDELLAAYPWPHRISSKDKGIIIRLVRLLIRKHQIEPSTLQLQVSRLARVCRKTGSYAWNPIRFFSDVEKVMDAQLWTVFDREAAKEQAVEEARTQYIEGAQ